jgi:hypothetical protein
MRDQMKLIIDHRYSKIERKEKKKRQSLLEDFNF